jgi:hypothetical protein
MIHKATSFLRHGPETSAAAKSGTPTMVPPKPEVPATVPVPAEAGGFTGDVTVAPVTGTSALDTQPDARTPSAPADSSAKPADEQSQAPAAGSNSNNGKNNGKNNRKKKQ